MLRRLIILLTILIVLFSIVLGFVLSNNDLRILTKSKTPKFVLNSYRYVYWLINSKKQLENKIKNYEISLQYEKAERIKKELII